MTVDYSAIGKRIKKKRKELQLTQENLAEALAVSIGYVSQMERGITKINLDTLSEIAAYLSCDVAELITGTVPQQSNYLDDELNHCYQSMDTKQKKMLLDVAHTLLKQYGKE